MQKNSLAIISNFRTNWRLKTDVISFMEYNTGIPNMQGNQCHTVER